MQDQTNMTLKSLKLRSTGSIYQKTYVKLEKLSISGSNVSATSLAEMPPPLKVAPLKKKGRPPKTSKVRVKKEKRSEIGRESDLIVEEPKIPVVDLLDDSDLNAEVVDDGKNIKRQVNKRSRSESSSDCESELIKKEKRSVTDNQTEANVSGRTVYEDAIENHSLADATFTTSSRPLLNETIIIEKPKLKLIDVSKPITIDKSEETTSGPSSLKIKTVAKNQVFSPFEESPVKKKVEAFERLRQDSSSSIPMRVTRTKTKAKPKQTPEKEPSEQNNVKEKAKLFTPGSGKFLPGASNSTTKLPLKRQNETSLSAKSASALKAAQAEFRDREKRRREKESEALKKREALLLAQAEEKKRKREEKQLRAQQQREALEIEKMKTLEVQRLKDERHRQILAEHEEKKLKQKEELEKKRMAAKQKAIEEKKKLEEQKQTELLESAQKEKTQRNLPVYLKTLPPLLPTTDCYDSDDEDMARREILSEPTWAKNIKHTLQYMEASKEKAKNAFFSRKPQTADLIAIFEVIDPRKLKRSSSAIWHKPPRYTTYQAVLENHDETAEFLECDDD